jgi:multidrug resistance efflux pump
MTEESDLDSSSEAIRDYLNHIPSWITRWGSSVFAVIFVIGFFLSWLIKYPTVVRAEFKLTTKLNPKPLVTRVSGRLSKLLVKNHEHVIKNQVLGYLESTASYEDILLTEKKIETVERMLQAEDNESWFDTVSFKTEFQLGEVHVAFVEFSKQYSEFGILLSDNYFEKKISLLHQDISGLKNTNEHLKNQHQLYKRDFLLAKQEFELNKKLFNDKVIAKLDLDHEESKMLAKAIPVKNTELSLLNNDNQIRLKESEMIELNKLVKEQKMKVKQALLSLNESVSSWKYKYVLASPTEGEVVLYNNLQEGDVIKQDTELFKVFHDQSIKIGTITIPQTSSGKVKLGQRVLIKFESYPFEEFGAVEGVISSTPTLSTSENKLFFAIVELPHGLTTNHGKNLDFRYGMAAQADIITEDLRLIERVFYTLRKILFNRE